MNNYKDAKVGRKIVLLKEMVNSDSDWMPKESIPENTQGTITWVNINGDKRIDQIGVNWENGRSLGILPYKDCYKIIVEEN